MFFNSVSEIENFKDYFDQLVGDATNKDYSYLNSLNIGVISANRRVNGVDQRVSH